MFGGLLLPILAGWAYLPGGSIDDAFMFTAHGTVEAYLDLAWRNVVLTSHEVHFTLVLSVLVWGTMQFASYAVFGHRRPLAAVVMVGVLLAVNMAVSGDQLLYLLLYTTASLFLLIQMHAFDERSTWIRRRIGDPSQLSALYLRGGAVFIVLAMTGSLLLTTRAASAPLAGAWDGAVDTFYDIGQELTRFLPMGGDFRAGGGVSFGQTARVKRHVVQRRRRWRWWPPRPAPIDNLKWRAATYDTFTGTDWVQSIRSTRVPVVAGQPLLTGLPEEPKPDLTTQVTVSVTPQTYRDTLVVTPGTPVSVSRDAEVLAVRHRQLVRRRGAARRPGPLPGRGGHPLAAGGGGGHPEPAARGRHELSAGHHPSLHGCPATGSSATRPTSCWRRSATCRRRRTRMTWRWTMEKYLAADEPFHYDADLSDDPPCDLGVVECFARIQRGSCLHYATTMAILLREIDPEHPIPTRVVQGFLPGERGRLDPDVPQQACPRLGRGVLPRPRLDQLRPDRRRHRDPERPGPWPGRDACAAGVTGRFPRVRRYPVARARAR